MTIEKTEIEALDEQILQLKKKRAEMRRAMPREIVEDFTFETADGAVSLSELFGDKPDLLVVHNMASRACTARCGPTGSTALRRTSKTAPDS